MQGRSVRALTSVAGVMVLLASCSSGDFWEKATDPRRGDGGQQAELDPSIRMPALSAAVQDGHVRLQWRPVKRISRYRIDDGRSQMDVPAAICAQTCTLGLPPRPEGGRQEFAVSAVTAAGAFSKASTATVQAPEPEADEPVGPLQEVVVIRQDHLPEDPENNSPTVERIPVDSGAAARREIEKTWSDPDVISASVNHRITTTDGDDPPAGSTPTNVLWQRDAMEFDRLPGDPRGEGITVAMVESGGVDATHPSLKGAVEEGASITGDGTGISTPTLHGTATSSLIVGQPAGDIPGVAPGAEIMPVALGEDAKAADLVEGIIWAVDHGADIINISAGTSCNGPELSGCPDSLRAASAYAEEAGVVVVAAAGNNGPGTNCARGTNHPWSPAIVDSVISVGAYRADGKRWECSPLRSDIDILAPGAHLMHAWLGGGYGTNSGTSFSAPLISGLIATILAERPDLEPSDIRQMLPKWRLADGRLSTYAMLVDLDIIETDDQQPRVGDMDLAGIFPFEAFIGIGTGHPIRKELEAAKKLQFGNPGGRRIHTSVSIPWWDGTGSGFGGSLPNQREEPWGYGAITGQVYLHKDGSVSAAGWMSLNRISPGLDYGLDLTGWHRMVCDAAFVNPARKQFRWDTPVKVGVSGFTAGNDTTPARAKLTFSLGTGATTGKHGQLPPVTVGKDTLGDCPGQIAAQKGRDPAASGTPQELAAVFDEYARSIERIEHMLVQATPVTTAEAVPLSGTDAPTETRAEQDPNLHLNIDVS
ncbi:S8 family peptidase [Streptomyces phytophilus]|uniref:S8 family peptidase n=1 Tax=Streptomyces phytophilus TaxID=722715 RepID=UPI0015F05E5A|nr:S8 family serine peptidase [Streptomyces phytophilus]